MVSVSKTQWYQNITSKHIAMPDGRKIAAMQQGKAPARGLLQKMDPTNLKPLPLVRYP
jgi:hypothetical protein